MIDVKSVKIDFKAQGKDEIFQNVKTILSTPAGTVPFDRDFGIDWSVLDNPLELAKGLLAVEYIEKVRKYESRASVKEVLFEADGIAGQLIPKVVIELES